MKTITVYEDTAVFLEKLAEKWDTTIADIIDDLIYNIEIEYIQETSEETRKEDK